MDSLVDSEKPRCEPMYRMVFREQTSDGSLVQQAQLIYRIANLAGKIEEAVDFSGLTCDHW